MLASIIVHARGFLLLEIIVLVAYVVATVGAYLLVGAVWVLAYYGVGAIFGIFLTYRHRDVFLRVGGLRWRRALRHSVVIMLLWPFIVVDGILYAAGY